MGMKSIEERAALNLIYEKDFCGNSLSDNMVCRAYVRGAKEQKAIDDAKWLKIKSSWEKEAQINHDDVANYKQGYHDAIEKACNWLKERVQCGMHLQSPYGFAKEFRKAMEE